MQAGTPVSERTSTGYRSTINDTSDLPTQPADAALAFYIEFSDPSKRSYSWNRSLPNSFDYFLGGDSALYLGYAHEIEQIRLKNANLNFGILPVPISREGGAYVSAAKFMALAIPKRSANILAAFTVAATLSGPEGAPQFSKALNLPPARRALLAQAQTDYAREVFYESAVRAKTWADPDPEKSDTVFKNMIEGITSGRLRQSAAIGRASDELNSLYATQR
jgi:ABC-type glycerol-3-phosphate transport system substrate-binding protein